MSHDRGCPCGRESYEYDDCVRERCFKRPTEKEVPKLLPNDDFLWPLDGGKQAEMALEVPLSLPVKLFLHANRFSQFQEKALKLLLMDGRTEADRRELHKILVDHAKHLARNDYEPNKEAGDNVTLPNHYARYPIEPTYFAFEAGLDKFDFNCLKYICRYPFKNGIEDVSKAARYCEMGWKFYAGDPNWSR